MIEYDTKLNNVFGFSTVQLQTQIQPKIISEHRFSITKSGKIHEMDSVCPCCHSASVVHNGNDKCKSKIVKELGLVIKKGKFKCKKCSKTWTTSYKDADLFVTQYKQLIATTVFHLCSLGISLENIVEHILITFSKEISHEWVRQLYINAAKEIKQKKVLKTSGIFNYDEQYLKVNGKEYFRIVVMDAVSKKVIFDKEVENKRIDTLKDELRMQMLPYNKEVFIVDLALGYPKMLKELFPKAKVQWCIFHLNKLIVEDFAKSKKLNRYGKKILPLEQLYNFYKVLSLFYCHEVEVSFLKRKLKQLIKGKEMLKGCSCYEENPKIISFYEMKLISEFTEFRKGLKKYRRKQKGNYLIKKNKQETLDTLKKLESENYLFPKKVQNRIKKIRRNLDKLTLFQENPLVQPTNNNIEQYYSATLQKTAKKRFRNTESLQLKLKIIREKWNQTLGDIKFNFLQFLRLFAKINYFFGPT